MAGKGNQPSGHRIGQITFIYWGIYAAIPYYFVYDHRKGRRGYRLMLAPWGYMLLKGHNANMKLLNNLASDADGDDVMEAVFASIPGNENK